MEKHLPNTDFKKIWKNTFAEYYITQLKRIITYTNAQTMTTVDSQKTTYTYL